MSGCSSWLCLVFGVPILEAEQAGPSRGQCRRHRSEIQGGGDGGDSLFCEIVLGTGAWGLWSAGKSGQVAGLPNEVRDKASPAKKEKQGPPLGESDTWRLCRGLTIRSGARPPNPFQYRRGRTRGTERDPCSWDPGSVDRCRHCRLGFPERQIPSQWFDLMLRRRLTSGKRGR